MLVYKTSKVKFSFFHFFFPFYISNIAVHESEWQGIQHNNSFGEAGDKGNQGGRRENRKSDETLQHRDGNVNELRKGK